MFLYNTSSPTDQRSLLEPGLYEGNGALYVHDASPHAVFMAEYRAAERNIICAVEIFLYKKDGSFNYCNIVRLPNGCWRNNLGEINRELTDFLPEDLLRLRVSKNMALAPQIVGTQLKTASPTYVH